MRTTPQEHQGKHSAHAFHAFHTLHQVFGAMTKENLVSDGVLPASSLEAVGFGRLSEA